MQYKEEREPVLLYNEGQKIFGVFHTPVTDAKVPAVLMCHGLAGHKAGKYRSYVHLAERFVQEGTAVLRIDFRGAGDSEGDIAKTTLDTEVSDAHLALDYLAGDARVDAERLGIFGRSFGGAVAVTAAHQHGGIKALVLWAAVFNGDQWRDQWQLAKAHHFSAEELIEMMRIEGQVPGMPFYERLFQMHLEQEVEALQHVPMLIIHSLRDQLVNFSHADAYMKCREGAEAETKLITLEKSDHDFSDHKERDFAVDETVKWLKEHL